MFRAIAAVFLLPSFAFAQSRVEPAKGYEAVADALAPLIREQLLDKNIPAISIALVSDQEVVWAAGFGMEHPRIGRPATAETVYRVGSVSKLYTDTLVMQLVEKGKLDLDAPITKYLRTFVPTDPFNQSVTLRQLMAHRSGLVRESPVGHYFDPDPSSLSEVVKSLNRTEMVYPPGERTKYSNAGIATVGHVVEKVTRVPFATYARKQLLDPLDMRSTSFALDHRVTPRFAESLMWTYHGREFASPVWDLSMPPAGTMYSTVLDQTHFLRMLFAGGTYNGVAILKPETLKQMMTEQYPGGGFGHGFAVGTFDGKKRVGHGGAVYGFATELAALPEQKLGVVVCASKDIANGQTSRIANEALRLLVAKQEGKALPLVDLTTKLAPGVAKKMAGRWANDEKFFDLTETGGRLFLVPGEGGFRQELRRMGEDFVVDDLHAFGAKLRPEGQGLVWNGDSYTQQQWALPPECPKAFDGLLGEYGWNHNILTILEKDGKLHALIEWAFLYPLKQIGEDTFAFPDFGLYHGEKLIFTRDTAGRATQVEAASVVFQRRVVQGEDGKTFRIKPVKPVDELLKLAKAATPPVERGEFRAAELVDLAAVDPAFQFDIRYATDNNFLSTPLYTSAKAFLQKPAAEALARVNKSLSAKGYGLLVYDAYRPWFVTKTFFDATPDYQQQFVADPAKGSRHNRGCAVDLTLYDLATKKPVAMVGGYDEFSDRAYPDYVGGTSRQRWHRELLKNAMEAEGFVAIENEWWHFDYRDWRSYGIGNASFEALGAKE